jgi:hypothetical protein
MCSRAARAWVSAPARTSDGDAVELGVQLQRRDEVLGAGDLEVHVTEGVLGAEDVGQRDVLGLAVDLVGDQAHGDAGDRAPQRHTGVEQRQGRGADRAHGRRAVGAQRLGHLPDRVGELLAVGQHRQQRPLGQRAVADLAALGRADAAGLTGGVRREVVVVHVALAVDRRQRVQLLLHAEHVQRGDAQDLGLAALEQRRAVHPREDLDRGRERADVGQAAAVDPHLVAQDALADDLLGQRPEGSGVLFSRPSNRRPGRPWPRP